MAAASLLTLGAGPLQAQTPAQVPAQALPSGLSVAAGQAQVSTNGNRMTVTNSPKAILNWSSFSIGTDSSVYFQQQGAASQVLNRVTGNDASQILGSLGSNGRVWLLNPNGVLFGQSARVDVAGLVASTLRVGDADWLAGRFRFQEAGSTASVVNQGELRTAFGGTLALVGGSVGNDGLMLAPGGQAILAAGSSVELVDTGAANLSVRIAAPAGAARNLGIVDAAGGRIDIHAAAVNQRGIVRADALASGPGGEIWIRASGAVELGPASRTSADAAGGGSGGGVTLQSDAGRTTVQGQVSAVAGSLDGSGGQVVVLGREVSVQDAARIDVSGGRGGGSVIVGGGTQGRDPRYANAEALYFGPQAQIAADATHMGDGGDIVLWSDKATRAFGSLSARGGLIGGNGGFIETSGGWLDARPAQIDTAAPRGAAGSWLLDPYNIFISDNTSTSGFGAGPTFTASQSNSSIATSTIVAALANANVTISTGGVNGGNENGNITVSNATIVTNLAAARSLTLLADGLIGITDSQIRSNNGVLTVNLQAAQTRNGGIEITDSSIVTGSGSTWGDLTLGGARPGVSATGNAFSGAGGAVPYGVRVTNSTLDAGSGALSMLATSSQGGGSGVLLDVSDITARSLVITGDGPTGVGVELAGSFVRATHDAIVNGRGLANGVWVHQDGQLSVLPNTTDTTATLTIEGQSRTPSGGRGVAITPDGTRTYGVLTGRGASMTITGDSLSGDTLGAAVYIGSPGSSFPAVDASGGDSGGGRSLTIQTSGGERHIEINNAIVVTGSGTTLLQASGGSRIALLNNSSMDLLGNTVFSAQDITIGGSSDIVAGGPLSLNLNATRDLSITDAGIVANGGPLAIGLQAGGSAGGSLRIGNSQIFSGGGAISIGGTAGGTTPTGSSFSGVGSNGSLFSVSTIDAGSGAITIAATAANSGGIAVELDDTTLTAYSIALVGDAPLGTGIALGNNSEVAATHDLSLRGRGQAFGVRITPGSQASVVPPVQDTSASGLVQGRALDSAAGLGVGLNASGSTPALVASRGAGLVVEAASPSPGDALRLVGGGNAAVVDARSGGPLTLRTFDNGASLSASGATLYGGNGLVTVQAADTVTLGASQLLANGAVRLVGNRVALTTGGLVQSQATGDAIVVSGSAAPLAGFANGAGANALAAPNGRWIVYAGNINDTGNFAPGALPYAFKRYNAAFGGWSADSGNGLVFQAPQSAVYTGTVQSRPYDGTAGAVLSNASISSISVAGDSGVLQPGTVRFLAVDAGTNVAAAFDNPAPFTFVDSNGRPVYGYTVSGALSGTITPRQLSAAVTASKVYDATTAAVPTFGALSNLVGSETVGVSGSGSYNNKNVGSNKPLTLSYTLQDGANGGKAANYSFAPSATPLGTITARPLALAGLSAADKVYDATSNATIAGTPGVTPLAGDSVTVGGSPTARFADKNAGAGKPVTVTGYTLGGTDGANYTLTQPAGLTATITPRPLAVGGVAAANKVYDATVAASLTGSATATPLAGDALGVAGSPSAAFVDKNVGTGKAVTVTGYVFSGADAGNYTPLQPGGLTASISPRQVAVTGVTALDKVYDATTAATLGSGAGVALLPGDLATLGGSPSAAFDNKNVGSGKTVTIVGGYQLAGADAGNYSLVQPLGTTASITPRPISLAGVAVADKVYDATTTASFSGTATVSPLAGDTVVVSGTPVAFFADKNAGVAKPVLVSGYALGGADAANYTLGATGALTASITPRPLAVTGISASPKVYDGGTAATLSGSAAVAALSGDNVQLTGSASAAFVDRNAGSAKPVTVSGLTLAGGDAANYALLPPQNLSAAIAPALLTYVAEPAVRSVGQIIGDLPGSVTGFLVGESIASATSGTLAFTTAAAAGSPVGTYAVQGTGLAAQNYVFTQAPFNATALSIVDLTPNTAVLVDAVDNAQSASATIASALSATRPLSVESGLANLTALSVGTAGNSVKPVADFKPVRLSSLSAADLQSLLAGRDMFKKALLADAVQRLQDDPRLADLRECRSLAEAQSGGCVIGDVLKAQVQQQAAAVPAPEPPPAAEPPPATAGTPAVPATPAPAPTPVPAPAATLPPPVGTAPPPPPPPGAPVSGELDPLLREVLQIRRRVVNAALPQIERKIALVIGVDNYADKSIPPLGNAVRDARSVARLFETKLGYEAVVLDNATRATLVAALNRLALTVGPRDSVIIYYAGHGELVESTKLGYWLLSDSVAKTPETWLSNTDISRLVGQMGASQVALISDSCYSGSLASEERIRATPSALDPQAVLARKSVVVMSSGGNEPVFDEGREGHSPFAWNLMNTLGKVSDWQAGGNVFERVRFAVARELPQRPQYSASRAAGHQAGGDYLFEQRQLGAVR